MSEIPGVAATQLPAVISQGNGNGTMASTQPASRTSINTAALIAAMISMKGASDLIFSPGRPPQVELNGSLRGIKIEGLPLLLPEHTAKIAQDLIGNNKIAAENLKEDGSCDLSY